MELKAEQLVELMLAMGAQTQQKTRNEKRSSPRLGVRYPIRIHPLIGTTLAKVKPVKAWTRDISGRGLGICCDYEFTVGQHFVIEFPRVDGSTLNVLCMVANTHRTTGDVFTVGAQFVSPWCEQELKRAKADKSPPTVADAAA